MRFEGRSLRVAALVLFAGAIGTLVVACRRDAAAAGEELQFLGPWKARFKGGGDGAPGVTLDDLPGRTELRLDPGFSSAAGGSPKASLKAKRKVRIVDPDGGGVILGIGYEALHDVTGGAAAVDVAVFQGKSPVMFIPSARHATPPGFRATLSFNWNYEVRLPAGDYLVVVTASYLRGPTGSYGNAAPPNAPFLAYCRLVP